MNLDRFSDPKHISWSKAVKKRDEYRCVICLRGDLYLHSHHLYNWADFPELRFDVENGITICQEHHHEFHQIYGKNNNTKAQFNDFKRTIEIIKTALSKLKES